MYKKRSIQFQTMLQCFDTLTELIQGTHCFNNKKALISGNFLDLCSKLLEYDEKIIKCNTAEQSRIVEKR